MLKVKKTPENVSFLGQPLMNSKEMEKIISNHQLYVHFGRGEAFGVTALESMSAGIPTIVSNLTGVKEAVEKVRKDFVVPLEVDKAKEKILEFFDLDIIEKKALSKEFKEVSNFYSEDKQLKEFRKTFGKLLEEVYGED